MSRKPTNWHDDLTEHAENIEAAMAEKVDDVMMALDMVRDIMFELNKATAADEKKIRNELRNIWTSVMESPYDPNY